MCTSPLQCVRHCALQVWEKLTNYMEIEPRWVANRPGNYMASTEDLVAACDENTIGEASGNCKPC